MLNKLKQYIRLNRLGYISDQLGIAHRYHAEGTSWSNHLNKTGTTLISTIKERSNCTVAIIGSGVAAGYTNRQNTPTSEPRLSNRHKPPQANTSQVGQQSKISFIETDITGGGANLFWNILKGNIRETEALNAAALLKAGMDIPNTDVVFSVNILSQLAHIPAEQLKEKKKINPTIASQLIYRIQLNHLEWLKSRESILIADFEEELFDEEDRMCGVNQLCFIDPKQWQQVDRWRWKFDTKMTYRSDYKTYLQVGVFHRKVK